MLQPIRGRIGGSRDTGDGKYPISDKEGIGKSPRASANLLSGTTMEERTRSPGKRRRENLKRKEGKRNRIRGPTVLVKREGGRKRLCVTPWNRRHLQESRGPGKKKTGKVHMQ